MTLFSSPEEHTANPPETWRIVKYGRGYTFVPQTVTDEDMERGSFLTFEHFERKRDAVAALKGETHSWATDLYAKESRWYAGEIVHPWKPWAEVKAERDRTEERLARVKAQREREERRKVERLGITVDKLGEWREALAGLHIERDSDNPGPNDDDAAEAQRERLDAALDAFHAVLRLIESGDLMDPAHLDDEEAQALHHDLSQTWALETGAEYWIDRIRYKGLDSDLSALEVLDLMVQAEREEVMPGLKAVAA